MAENPTMAFRTGFDEVHGFDEMGNKRVAVVPDQADGFNYNMKKNDSFIVDIEGLNHSVDSNSSSRIAVCCKLQRNLSRKGSLRVTGEKRMCSSPTSNEWDGTLLSVGSLSPKASSIESGMPEVPAIGTAAGTSDRAPNLPSHHQIIITAGNIGTNGSETKWSNKRSYSFRRPPPSWAVDPRKILLFFATLSSIGTILLIYFTLSMSKASIEVVTLE